MADDEKRPQLFVPDWVKSARASVCGVEAEVIRIPTEEFADPDFVVPAEFPDSNPERLCVGQAWEEKRAAGRVVVICRLDACYAYCRNETEPHRRVRIFRDRLQAHFAYVGSLIMSEPQFWPDWFAEDVSPTREENG